MQQHFPTLEELMEQQQVGAIADPTELLGDFWPSDEPIERFLDALHEWRWHTRNDHAA